MTLGVFEMISHVPARQWVLLSHAETSTLQIRVRTHYSTTFSTAVITPNFTPLNGCLQKRNYAGKDFLYSGILYLYETNILSEIKTYVKCRFAKRRP